MLTGLIVMATNFAVKNYFTLNLGHNATIIIELSIGLAVGMARWYRTTRSRRIATSGPVVGRAGRTGAVVSTGS
jgi:hypothetical protein